MPSICGWARRGVDYLCAGDFCDALCSVRDPHSVNVVLVVKYSKNIITKNAYFLNLEYLCNWRLRCAFQYYRIMVGILFKKRCSIATHRQCVFRESISGSVKCFSSFFVAPRLQTILIYLRTTRLGCKDVRFRYCIV